MRKFIVVGILIAAVLAVSAASILAQDATPTPTAPAAAWLGIAVIDHNGQVMVARVQAGSPANAADLLIGDVIVSYNGTKIDTAATLRDQLKNGAPGDKVTLDLLRNDQPVSVDVTLGASPASIFGRGMGMGNHPGMGFGMQMDTPTLAARLLGAELKETDAGFEVTSVSANRNPFDLQVGDVVTALNGQNIKELNLQSLHESMMGTDQPKLTLSVTRDGKSVDLIIDVNMRGMGRAFGQGLPFGHAMPFGHGMPFGNRGHGFGQRGNGNNNDSTNGNGVEDNGSGIVISGQA